MDLYVIGDLFHHHNHAILHNANMRFWWWLGISNYDVYHSENKRKSFFFCDGVVMACTLNSSVFSLYMLFQRKRRILNQGRSNDNHFTFSLFFPIFRFCVLSSDLLSSQSTFCWYIIKIQKQNHIANLSFLAYFFYMTQLNFYVEWTRYEY